MVLGTSPHAAPPFSVIVLPLAGYGTFHRPIALACMLIAARALVAAKDMLHRHGEAANLPDGTAWSGSQLQWPNEVICRARRPFQKNRKKVLDGVTLL